MPLPVTTISIRILVLPTAVRVVEIVTAKQ